MAAEELERLTPREIVSELDKYIVGQGKAKRSVAVALRNRVRRLRLEPEIRDDVTPKNILMIGPTGVGKTEIARRLAKLCGAPFIKVEATKYTEVGYVGRDVESMIRDLMANGYQMVADEQRESVKAEAERRAEEELLDLLLPGSGKKEDKGGSGILGSIFGSAGAAMNGAAMRPQPGTAPSASPTSADAEAPLAEGVIALGDETDHGQTDGSAANPTRERLRAMLRDGRLDQRTVEVSVPDAPPAFELISGGSIEEIGMNLSSLGGIFGGSKKKKLVSVPRAKEILVQEQADKLVDKEKVTEEARRRVQELGIVFIDEIDKIAAGASRGSGADVSREGVQRDILPIVEGSTVNTKWGVVDTSHVLFIGAGAFNVSKPSDLIPELQGRFPLRVELEALGKEDFVRILKEPRNSLTKQYEQLLSTEGVAVAFADDAIERIASLAADVNSRLENIGARRLHTIMETLLDELSFGASEMAGQSVTIDAAYVDAKLSGVVKDQDLGRYIL